MPSARRIDPVAMVREDIRALRFAPGEQVSIIALCDRYALSSIPIREALNRLAGEGLIERRTNKGFFYPRMGAGDLAQVYEGLFTFLAGASARACVSPAAGSYPPDAEHAAEVGAMPPELAVERHIVAVAGMAGNAATVGRVGPWLDLTHAHRVCDLRRDGDPESYVGRYDALLAAVRAGERARAQVVLQEIAARVHANMAAAVCDMHAACRASVSVGAPGLTARAWTGGVAGDARA